MKRARGTTVLAIVSLALACGCRFSNTAQLPPGLLDPYLRIHTALADDGIERLPGDAREMAAAAGRVGVSGRVMQAAALKLQDAHTLAAARLAFGELTDALIAYAQSVHRTVGRDNRVAFCPMVQKRWIQAGDAIRNPYYGHSMLTCGTFQEPLR